MPSGSVRVRPGPSGFVRAHSAHADITHLCCTIHTRAMFCGSLVFLRLAKVSLRGMRRLVAKLAPRDFFAIPLLENCWMREAAVALSFAMGLPVIHNHRRS